MTDLEKLRKFIIDEIKDAVRPTTFRETLLNKVDELIQVAREDCPVCKRHREWVESTKACPDCYGHGHSWDGWDCETCSCTGRVKK